MRTVALAELPARREELLESLAHGESFTVIDGGREVATLAPTPTQPALADHGQDRNAFDLIADLIGSVDGPRDLSDKKRHLIGFGREGRRSPLPPSSLPPE